MDSRLPNVTSLVRVPQGLAGTSIFTCAFSCVSVYNSCGCIMFLYLLAGCRIHGAVRRLKYELYAWAPAYLFAASCEQILENLHGLIEMTCFFAMDIHG